MPDITPKCFCGHAKRNHANEVGLCLVASCKNPICLGYRPDEHAGHWYVECPDYVAGPFRSRDAAEAQRVSIDRGSCLHDRHTVTATPSHPPGSTAEPDWDDQQEVG